MAKQNKKLEGFVEYIYKVEKKGSKWIGTYHNQGGICVILVEEKTKRECQRVLEVRLKQQRKQDREDYINAERKVESLSEKAERIASQADAKTEEKPKKKANFTATKRYQDSDQVECSKCHDILDRGDFYKDKSNNAGVMNWCKACLKEHKADKKRQAEEAGPLVDKTGLSQDEE